MTMLNSACSLRQIPCSVQKLPMFKNSAPTRLPRRPELQRPATDTKSTSSSGVEATLATVEVHFSAARVTVAARPGDNIYELAEKAGIDTVVVGCCSGNCGVCEVEVRKYSSTGAQQPGEGGEEAASIVVRSCITPIPPGYARIEVNELIDDVWGLDGYDT